MPLKTAQGDRSPDGVSSDGSALWRHSAELATWVSAAALPYRCALHGRKLWMRDWASALSPRQDLRVLAVEAWSPEEPLRPVLPAGPSQVHWSRLLVGRGVGERWPQEPHDERALKFAYRGMPLPRTFPRDLVCEGGSRDEAQRRGAVAVGVGCSDGLLPWLASLASPLEAQSGPQRAALAAAGLSSEDRAAMAEDLRALADAYSQ